MKTRRALLLAAAALSVMLAPLAGQRVSAQTAAPYELPSILSLSGPVAYAGKDEQQAIEVIENVVNKTGGIQGHPLKITFYDDQSNPQVAVQLMNQQIAHGAQVVLGPMFTAPCAATAPIVEKTGPVMYCLTPGYQPTSGGFVFSPGTATPDVDETYLRYALAHHWTRFAVLTTTDATGQAAVNALPAKLALPEFKAIQLVDQESMNAADLSVSAQLQRIKAARPDIIYFTGSGPPYGTMLRGLADAGMDVPIASSSANMSASTVQQYHDILPKTALFTASRGLAIAATPKGPVLTAQQQFYKSMEAGNVKVSGVNVNVWDPTWILIDTLRKLGPNATKTQIRDYIQHLHDWVGVSGVYDFSHGDPRGIGADSIVVYQYDPAKSDFVPVSGPGGRPLR